MADKIEKIVEVTVITDKGGEIEKLGNDLDKLKTNTNNATVATDKFSSSQQGAVTSVTKNGGAMGILNSITNGYAQIVKDALEASELFTISKKVDTVTTEVNTVATVSNNTATQQGIIAKIKDAAAWVGSKIAMGATTIATGIATAAQWLWNAAIVANPLVAFVVAIVATIAGIYKLTTFLLDNAKANETAAESTKANTKALEEQTKAFDRSNKVLEQNNKNTLAMAKAKGATTEELRKLTLKLADEEVAIKKANATIAQGTFIRERNALAMLKQAGASDEVIESQEKLVQASYKEFQSENSNLRDAYDKRKQATIQNNIEIEGERTKSRNDEKAKQIKHNEDLKAIQKKKNDDLKKVEEDNLKAKQSLEASYLKGNQDINDKTEEEKLVRRKQRDLDEIEALRIKGQDVTNLLIYNAEKYNTLETELADKRIAEEKVKSDGLAKIEKDRLDSLFAINQDFELKLKELSDETYQGQLEVKLARNEIEMENKLLELETLNADEEAKQLIRDYYRELNAEAEKESGEEVAQAKQSISESGFEALNQLSQLFLGSNEKDAKKAFEIDKAMRVGQTIMSSIEGVQNAFTSGSKINPAYGYTSAAIAGVFGAVKVATIMKQKFKGSGGGASAGSDGGGGGAQAPQANFNIVGSSGTNQLAQSINNKQNQPIQAYVVGSQVTSQQALDRNKQDNSTFL